MQHTITPLSTGNLPAEYRTTPGWKVCFVLCGLMFISLAIGPFWLDSPSSITDKVLLGAMSAVFGLVGLYVLIAAFQWRVVLYPDRLEDIGPLRTDIVPLAEIKGFRLETSTTPSVLVIELTSGKKLKLGLLFGPDELFDEWFAQVRALDAEDLEHGIAEILSDEKFGSTKDQRVSTLTDARRKTRAINIAASIVLVWGFFYPHPYQLATAACVILPWIAITFMKRSRGLIHADEQKNDPHPSVAITLLMTTCVLMLRATLDFDILPERNVFIWMALISAGFSGAIYWADPSIRKKASLVAFVLFYFAYGYGTAIIINSYYDEILPVTYTAFVQDMDIQSGKHTEYNLTLYPWGGQTKPESLDVGKTIYSHIHKGQTVSIRVHKGLLGIRWYYVVDPR